METNDNDYQRIAELICELTRNCNIKEDFFAASFNLSPTEVRLLKLFAFADSYSIKEIREKLNLTAGRITHILGSLEAKKILQRVPEENDKRNINVQLLPKANRKGPAPTHSTGLVQPSIASRLRAPPRSAQCYLLH